MNFKFDKDYDDETGAGGLWDFAAEIAKAVAVHRGEEGPIYAAEWGQEAIYNLLMERSKDNV